MTERRLHVVRIQVCDAAGVMGTPARIGGGLRSLDHADLMVVKWTNEPRTDSLPLLSPSEPGPAVWRFTQLALRLQPYVGKMRGAGRLAHLLWHIPRYLERRVTERRRARARALGYEDFEYPATWNLLNRLPWKPDILHLHNLHDRYFDLRALPWLTRRVPTVVTLHDAWLLTGHCAHPMGCDRWRTGCGACPDLTIYPALEKDGTAYNWVRKRSIYERSRFHLTAPARYLLEMAQGGILAPAILSARTIPNGIDVELFSPGNRREARERLHLPDDAAILVFVASDYLKNAFKDWPTVRHAAEILAGRMCERPIVLVGIGDTAPDETAGNLKVRHAGLVRDQKELVQWYRSADLCVHAARADTFPGVVLEALAAGVPVVATAVCGVPEQVKSLTDRYTPCMAHDLDEATGILVTAGDAEAMADACVTLLRDDVLRARLSANAVRDARERFSNERMVRAYLELYEEILSQASAPMQ